MRVAVTGASGFIGSHVVRVLLAAGHEVRATVRDPSDEEKTAHLRRLPGSDRLELLAANLREEGSFDAAFTGCEGVCHVASPVALVSKNPVEELIEPAVDGTLSVLRSADRAGTVRRVALTSSTAAVVGWEAPSGHYTEADWNETSVAERSPYLLAKTQAERAAWEFVKDRELELVSILPSFVFGPVMTAAHLRSSVAYLTRMVTGKMRMYPHLCLPMVDVEAVAQAHRLALEKQSANGRYILSDDHPWLAEIAALIRQKHPDLPVPRRRAPRLLLYLHTLFDAEVSVYYLRCCLGKEHVLDGTRIERELGIAYAPWDETILETVASIREVLGS